MTDNRSMDEIREELTNIARESVKEAFVKMNEWQEEILIAFIAKYGLQPDEVVICHQGSKMWVEKKTMENINV